MSSHATKAIELLSSGRPIELVRAFDHGAGGTSLARVDGDTVGDYGYLLYEYVEGEWPARVDANLANFARMIADGDPSLDIHPQRLRDHPKGQGILRGTQAALDACDPGHLRSSDVVHGDFAPENLLVNIYAIRYASWPLNTDMESDVLNTVGSVSAAMHSLH